MYILALVPYTKTSKPGDDVNWQLVIFNKWIDLGRKFDPTKETCFTYEPCHQNFAFKRCWGPNLKDEDLDQPYHFDFIDAPWARFLYKEEYLNKDGKWSKCLRMDELNKYPEQEEDLQKFTTTFKFFENGKRIVVKATLTANKYYRGIHWFPKFLKPLFQQVETVAEIQFSTDIGRDRGTWKGGTVRLCYPFRKNLATTWLDFEYNELPKYLKGEK